jgi:uncharacterized membrane protein YedE/YeeE
MTEAELIESVTAYYQLTGDFISTYVTVCTGYLVAAYLIGSKLTKSQVFVISTLYTFVAGLMSYGIYAFMTRGFGYVEMHKALNPQLNAYSSPVLSVLVPTIFVAGILACLKFMWDIRHPKTE